MLNRRRFLTTATLSVSLAAAALFATGGATFAEEAKAGNIMIEAPFARATPGSAKAGGAFLTLRNEGDEADTLISAEADVADRVELHTHINDNGVMRMRKVDGIDVAAHGTTELKPGGYHVMFIGLKAPLKEGEAFPLKLTFAKSGSVTITMPVRRIGAMSADGKMGTMDHGNMGKMDHGNMDQGSMKKDAPAQ